MCFLIVFFFILIKVYVYDNIVNFNSCLIYFSYFVSYFMVDCFLYLFLLWLRDVLNMEFVFFLVELNNFLGFEILR